MRQVNLVAKHNNLITASYSLGVAEQRLVFLAIIEAREKKTVIEAGGFIRITAKQYEEHFGVEKHTSYEALKRAAQGLYNATLKFEREVEGCRANYDYRWLEAGGYIPKLGCVEIMFASWVIPLITRLSNQYTSYELKMVAGLTSEYAIRLYEIMIQWRKIGKTKMIELEDLRSMLGLNKEHQRIEAFKRRVLKVALEQINEHTDIIADYEQHKEGKQIVGFTFTFKQKKQHKKEKKITEGEYKKTLNDAQLGRIARNPVFMNDYNHLVSPTSPANASKSAWEFEMVNRLKRDPSAFNKRPLEDYLEY